MLNDKLAKTLIEKDYLHIDSQVNIRNKVGDFLIKRIINTDSGFSFELYNLNNPVVLKVVSEGIETIDGMTPEGFAEAYDILPNGEDKPEEKRRGRPLKVRSPEYIAAKAAKEAAAAKRKAKRLAKGRKVK